MNDDVQFGEVEEASPKRQLRPDQNAQFAVATVGQPTDRELRVYVDLDVFCDMETHARSDTRVELGGVLLGGQYEDDKGRPFVVINESIRAEHYEATRGSFKFTHETWQEIGRRRDEFPGDLQMVGWYHTHPDWGVFLSGMDLFICDNFFNRPLDVALVIDPCRNDRGCFVWTGDEHDPIRRTSGYRMFASRHRLVELEDTIFEIEAGSNMTAENPRFGTARSNSSGSSPIFHVGQAASPWQNLVFIGMLSMQFCLLAIVLWKVALGPQSISSNGATNSSGEELVRRWELERHAAELKGKQDLLESLASKWDGTPAPLIDTLADSSQRAERLESDLAAHQARERELLAQESNTKTELAKAQRRSESLERQLERVHTELATAREVTLTHKGTISKLEDQLGESSTVWYRRPWVVAASILLCLVAVGGAVIWSNRKSSAADDRDRHSDHQPSDPT